MVALSWPGNRCIRVARQFGWQKTNIDESGLGREMCITIEDKKKR